MTEIFLINLDRSKDRLESFRRTNEKWIPFTRVSAVDGATLSREQLHRDRLIDSSLAYSDGAAGCAMSHIALWKKAAAENRNLTVCEDDAVFNAEFKARSEALLSQLGANFDLVLWGWNFDAILSYELLPGISPCFALFNQDEMRRNLPAFAALSFAPSLYRLRRAFGTLCYTLSPEGAKSLIEKCLPLRPLQVRFPVYTDPFPNSGIDLAMNQLYPQLRAFVSLPPLVLTPNERTASTVQLAPDDDGVISLDADFAARGLTGPRLKQ